MKKVVFGVLMAVGVLAVKPDASKVVTVQVNFSTDRTGSIVVGESVPPDSYIFEDE